MGTAVVLVVLAVIVALAVRSLWRNRKKGGCSCGCGCGGCTACKDVPGKTPSREDP